MNAVKDMNKFAMSDDAIRKMVLNDETLYANCRANYTSDMQMCEDIWNYVARNREQLLTHIYTRLGGAA